MEFEHIDFPEILNSHKIKILIIPSLAFFSIIGFFGI